MPDEFISIGDAARLLDVSIDTLRRWDESGKLKAIRTSGGHRVYRKHDIEIFLNDLWAIASEWVSSSAPPELPNSVYCPTSPVFQARLGKMQAILKDANAIEHFSLLVAMAGEIGDNSFAHNLGNWPDVPGVLFAFDINKKQIILADRGRGVLKTLKRVRPELVTHEEALRVAFTEVVTGREPEKRGNGLKFVRNIIQDYPIDLLFQTGDALLELNRKQIDLRIIQRPPIKGCLVFITY